jgi:hypothetical protein
MGQAVVIEVIDALTRTKSPTMRNDTSRTEEPPQGARKIGFLRQHAGPSADTPHCTELIPVDIMAKENGARHYCRTLPYRSTVMSNIS